MAVRFQCPTCQSVLECPDRKAGEKVHCPKCGQRLLVPTPPDSPPRNKTVLGRLVDLASPGRRRGGSGGLQPRRPDPPPRRGPPRAEPEPLDALPLAEDEPEEQPRPLSTPASRMLWRVSSPALLLFVFFILPLPWVEVRCSAGAGAGKVLATQSGIETLYGGITPAPAIAKTIEQERREAAAAAKPAGRKAMAEEKNKAIAPAVLVALFYLAVACATVVALALPLGNIRTVVGVGILAVAVLLLFVQLLVGFPVETAMAESMAESAARERAEGGGGGALLAAAAFDVHTTAWPWVGWGFAVIAMGSFVAEFAVRERRALARMLANMPGV